MVAHSLEFYVERAVRRLCEKFLLDYPAYAVDFIAFSALDSSEDDAKLSYPAAQIVAKPFVEHSEDCGFGPMEVEFAVRTHVFDDKFSTDLDWLFANLTRCLTASEVTTQVAGDFFTDGLLAEGFIAADVDMTELEAYLVAYETSTTIEVQGVIQTDSNVSYDPDSSTRQKDVTYDFFIVVNNY